MFKLDVLYFKVLQVMFELDFLFSKDLDIIKYYSLFFSVFKINLFSACSVFIAGGMLIAQ